MSRLEHLSESLSCCYATYARARLLIFSITEGAPNCCMETFFFPLGDWFELKT